jgi:AcrR family transcriptional regulator
MMAEKPRYHHGNLRPALIEAGVELARTGGPDAVVVREASRRVGVSHNAAYRHFPDRDALVKAVAERSMSELARLMERLMAEIDPGDTSVAAANRRLRATGQAYVRFALTEPGLFRTAFAVSRRLEHFGPGEGAAESGLNPYELLNRQLDELMEAGGLPAERRPYADTTAWAGVHGISVLMLDGPLRDLPEAEREAATASLLDNIERGLTGP